jgi:hypothetical protein
VTSEREPQCYARKIAHAETTAKQILRLPLVAQDDDPGRVVDLAIRNGRDGLYFRRCCWVAAVSRFGPGYTSAFRLAVTSAGRSGFELAWLRHFAKITLAMMANGFKRLLSVSEKVGD